MRDEKGRDYHPFTFGKLKYKRLRSGQAPSDYIGASQRQLLRDLELGLQGFDGLARSAGRFDRRLSTLQSDHHRLQNVGQ